MKSFILLLVFIGTAALANAQDKIYMTNGKIIECKVTEVGTEEIKYTVSTEANAAVFAVKKIDVLRIEFANGQVEKFKEELEDSDLYIDNKKNAWKFDFMAPVYGSSIFGYERSIRPGFSLEANFGIIGLGYDMYSIQPRGALLKFGPRFMQRPDFRSRSVRYYHILKGGYIQPQVILGAYESSVNYYDGGVYNPISGRETTTYINLMISSGRQFVFNNSFLVDIYGGIGYTFTSTTTKHRPSIGYISEHHNYTPMFGSTNLGLNLPLAVTTGIKIGFLTR